MKKPDPITIFLLVCLGFLLLAMFTGCYTEKKAQEQVNKANDHYPQVVAKVARDLYPCTDLLRPDTLTIYQDSLVYIDCPAAETYTDIVSFVDTTLIRTPVPGKVVRVPVNIPVRTQVVTRYFEDSAKLKLAALELTKSANQISKLQGDITTITGSRNWYRRWFWWLILAVIILGGLTIYKLIR